MEEEWEPRSDWKRAAAGGLLACLGPLAIIVVCGAVLVAMVPSCEFPQFAAGDCNSTRWPLHAAARDGDIDRVRAALDGGADPNELDSSANSAMGCVLALMDRPPNAPDANAPWAQQASVIVSLLLDRGADPNLMTGHGQYAETPLALAIRRSKPQAATALLDHGADPSLEDCKGVPLLAAADRRQFDELLAHGADPNGTGPTSPVLAFTERGDQATFELLLAHGADLTRPDPLHPEVTIADQALVSAVQQPPPLLDRVLEVSGPISDVARARLLGPAVAEPDPTHLRTLLDLGLDPDVGTLTQGEAQHLVSKELLSNLTQAGAVPSPTGGTVPGQQALSALIGAMPAESTPTVPPSTDARLAACGPVTAGVFPAGPPGSLPDLWPMLAMVGRTRAVPGDPSAARPVPPIAIALVSTTTEDLALLLAHGADPNIVILDRFTPLELAALDCNVEAARMLLDHGADPTLAPGGRRPVDAACPTVASLLG